MDPNSLVAFVRFHAWANDRILTTAAGLTDEQLHRAEVLDHGSAFETLRHLVDVDWSWREACIGNDAGQTYVWDHGFVLDDLAAVHAFSLEEDIRLRSFVESLDQAGLNEPLPNGDPREPRWLVVAHVVNHGRSTAANSLAISPSADTRRAISISWRGPYSRGRARRDPTRPA